MELVLLEEQPGNVLSPRPQGTWAGGSVAASPITLALTTAVRSVLRGMPQGFWAFSSGPRAPAHLPEPRWLSRADIHPGNRGVGPQSRQPVLSPAGRGLTLSHWGWAPQYHVPRDTGREKLCPQRTRRGSSTVSVLGEHAVGGWERGNKEALGQGRSAQGESVVEPRDGRGAGMEEGTSQVRGRTEAKGQSRAQKLVERIPLETGPGNGAARGLR